MQYENLRHLDRCRVSQGCCLRGVPEPPQRSASLQAFARLNTHGRTEDMVVDANVHFGLIPLETTGVGLDQNLVAELVTSNAIFVHSNTKSIRVQHVDQKAVGPSANLILVCRSPTLASRSAGTPYAEHTAHVCSMHMPYKREWMLPYQSKSHVNVMSKQNRVSSVVSRHVVVSQNERTPI